MKPNLRLAFFSVFLFFSLFYAASPANAAAMPSLEEFVKTVTNGNTDELRGIYIPNTLALPVTRQPERNSKFVSSKRMMVTQFNLATKEGNVGLLAHNYLAGRLFFDVKPDKEIFLVYGGGAVESFQVAEIKSYESLPRGMYRDLSSGVTIGVGTLFNLMYEGERHLTLQTCIERDGDAEWGRLFIVAEKQSQTGRKQTTRLAK